LPTTHKLFHLYLPLADNEGVPFPEDLFVEVTTELSLRFGGLTHTQFTREAAFLGEWLEIVSGTRYRDEIAIFWVMADVSPETEAFFLGFKQVLMERFRQKEIFLIAHLVEVY
jgi:hypothetical protein